MSPKTVPKVKLNNGNEIPIIGLGTWKSPAGQVYDAVKIAVEAGYRHIDCAFVYGNEDEVGRALSELFRDGTVTREELFITSKLWNTYHSKEKAPECLNKTLKALGLDYLDLYLIHWPMGYKEGGDTFPKDANGKILYSDVDYVDTWKVMEEFVGKGMVKSIGLSNFNSEQIIRVINDSTIKPAVLQVECHPYLSQKKLIELCHSHNIVVTAYSPLGSPDRPQTLHRDNDPTLLEEPKVKEFAAKYNKSAAQILIKFQVQRGVVVLPKSVTKERIISNIDVFDFELNARDLWTLENYDRGHHFIHLTIAKDHKHHPFNIPF